jgi:hypothetical protein
MAKSAKEYILDSLKKTVPSLNELWTETAKGYGWDHQVHSKVSIAADAQGVRFEHPEEMTDELHTTEYGLNETPPKAAMRETIAKAKPAIENAGYKALSQMMKDEGLIK